MGLACLLSLAAIVGAAPSSSAPAAVEAAAPAADEQPLVLLTLPPTSKGDDRALRVEGMIRAHVEALPLTIVVQRQVDPRLGLRELLQTAQTELEAHAGAGMLWIDLGQVGDSITLHVLQRGREQIYSRSIDTPSLGEAVALETLANISAMAALALAEGRSVELEEPRAPEPAEIPAPTPVDTPEAPPTPTPAPPLQLKVSGEIVPQPWPRARLRLGYRGQNFAGSLPWLSAAELALAWRPDSQAHVELALELSPPARVDIDELGLSLGLQRVPLRLGGGYRFELQRGWGLELAAWVGLEPTRRTTTVLPAAQLEIEEAPPSWRIATTMGADLRASAALRDNVRAYFGVGFVALLTRHDYALAGLEQPLVRPSPLRLSAAAGVEFELLPR